MTDIAVHGTVAAGFEHVRDTFAEIVRLEGGDLLAQMAAFHRGEPVVDLWSGTPDDGRALLGIYSASKGLTHIVLALLVDDGAIDLDRPVRHYWPEFAAAGKGELLVRELASHQAGLVGARDGFTMAELVDDAAVAARLADETPFWRPGAFSGYHALVAGALTGEVIRRVSGATVQQLFAERLRDPLGLDLFLGLPAAEASRFRPAQPMATTPERLRALAASTPAADSLAGIAFNRHAPGSREVWELPNLPAARARGTASLGGIGTARGLARLYASLTGPVGGHEAVLSRDTAAAVAQVQTNGMDAVLGVPKAWAVGFHTYGGVYPSLGAGAFGHSGFGGQQALVDPRRQLSYAFLRRRAALPEQADQDHNRLLRALTARATAR